MARGVGCVLLSSDLDSKPEKFPGGPKTNEAVDNKEDGDTTKCHLQEALFCCGSCPFALPLARSFISIYRVMLPTPLSKTQVDTSGRYLSSAKARLAPSLYIVFIPQCITSVCNDPFTSFHLVLMNSINILKGKEYCFS